MSSLNRIVGHHPGVVSFLLFCGFMLMAGCAWTIHSSSGTAPEAGLKTVMYWLGALGGAVMWLGGSVLFGQNFGVNSWVAFFLGLIPPAGLGLTRLIGKEMSPHEAWAKQNPGLDTDKAAKRNYRPMKPLY